MNSSNTNKQTESQSNQINLLQSNIKSDKLQVMKDYFDNQYIQEQISTQMSDLAKNMIAQVQQSFCEQIVQKNIDISDIQRSVDDLLNDSQLYKNYKIEQTLKEQQLKEAQKMKVILEDRLKQVEQNIQILNVEKVNKGSSSLPKSNRIQTDCSNCADCQKDRISKVRSFIKDQKERENIRKQQQRLTDEKNQQQEKNMQLKEQRDQEDSLKKRQDQISHNLIELQKQSQQRQEFSQQANQKIKDMMKQTPLYLELKQKYEQVQKQISLEQKKKRLAEIRNLSKPITLEDIKQHQQKYEELKEQYKQQSEKCKGEKFHYKVPYQSETYKKVQEEQKILRNQVPEKPKQNIDALKDFLKSVPKPKVDLQKKTQLEQIKQKLKHKPNFKWYLKERDQENSEEQQINISQEQSRTIDVNPRQLGNEYLRQAKQYNIRYRKKNSYMNIQNQSFDSLSKQLYTEEKGSVERNSKVLIGGGMRNGETSVKKDYLLQMRQSHDDHKKKQIQNWERCLKNGKLNEQQKTERLLIEAEKLEMLAQQQEMVSKIKGKDYYLKDEEDQIDNFYINAIKAKLAALESEEKFISQNY